MTRPDRESWLMDMAELVAQRSTCSRLHVGAIAVRGGQILSAGYNGAPSGLPHCVHTNDDPCREAVHAEVNVIASAAKYGVSLQGATIYVTHSPCTSCAGLLVNAGITELVYGTLFRDSHGLDILQRAGIETQRKWGQ
ncbi:deoxycytidylate deaminase [Gordonia phage Nibbles]|uniref:Deoxycytidylate deaminase n=1 Tax=Gordonia phage Azira TaxID=3035369 RepID=A0AAF0GMY5_9CAUD|nr:deoxycytidylate deaminase [Gordonia phage Azira]WGH21047.1 deoxycytidylate deaminase [Gordonia phage Azira]WNM75490.1 deoxycytidylate deaminase [Gordonia phage Nibbles]